jgi:hypothetical protein
VTGSFREATIGGVVVILIKAGPNRPENAKQAEIGLASLLKILWIAPLLWPKQRA